MAMGFVYLRELKVFRCGYLLLALLKMSLANMATIHEAKYMALNTASLRANLKYAQMNK